MVGGGQLARMSHQAAIALGQSLRVLAASPADPAALVCADVHLGSPDDLDALRGLADGAEVVTFDHEGVPGALPRVIRVLIHYYADGAHEPRHVYLGDARTLREDLDSAQ